ncbi:hypothetical protein [Effusibacillus dendaii]|uniref:Uncharacterized protein n=1 Tax=Effusibacillus dendaii TaxID=2743772 RepID=A0A7I8DAR5_9BACL|nr:hypothetical protein [Effusibacillus dendaii]BCJ86442.1 hypothetical protein skT53_14270 [Effusibacillus dendaii]
MYVRVPFKNKGFDMDNTLILEGVYLNGGSFGYVRIPDGAVLADGWEVMTELEWLSKFESGIVSVDKASIVANGTDEATVTADVDRSLLSVDFFRDDDGSLICTQPVTNGKAILKVSSTISGRIRIRAGKPTSENKNIVEVTAQ